jgi:hypothetical protein
MTLRHLAAAAGIVFAATLSVTSVAAPPSVAAPSPGGAATSAVAHVQSADLAAHRAVYTLSLANARSGDVAGASGRMAYEVIDACDGWAVRQRLQMTITNRDGQDIQMLSDYTTWESKDGRRLRFRMRQTTDTAVTSEVAGRATLDRAGGGGEAHYELPANTTKSLPEGTLFPMSHTAAILTAAEAGKRFLALPLFDGTSADGAQDSFIVITSWDPPAANKWPLLSELPSGRVHVAFFDRTPATLEPDYEVAMRYWKNGVADDLQMDFGDFVMSGKLAEFHPEKSGC